jgi:polysaccharide export outer membrane protein
MRHGRLLVVLVAALILCGCVRRSTPYVYAPAQSYPAYAQGAPVYAAPAPQAYAYAAPAIANEQAYALDSGDRLRISVYGQDGLTNSYLVDAAGNVNLSLIGPVPARGFTTAELSRAVADRLRQGYIREPHVSVEVEAYRPFFILGEVTAPGQYPYVANMTVETAIAIAGGYSPRAQKTGAQLTRNVNGRMMRSKVPPNFPIRPGDTLTVSERWF